MRLHATKGAGTVSVPLWCAGGNAITLSAVADFGFAAGLGVGDDFGVLFAVVCITPQPWFTTSSVASTISGGIFESCAT
jgi:hypothetical protein